MSANPIAFEVFNQSPPFAGQNLFTNDQPLLDALKREGGGAAVRRLTTFGANCGSREAFERGRLANENPPTLKAYDAQGRRLDLVAFHPAYHECMVLSISQGLNCAAFEHLASPDGAARPGVNVARAAGLYMAAQMEAGHCCPITMTHAAVPTLLLQPDLADIWLPRILSRSYDPGFKPAAEKSAITIGMGMTEAQGGTDVRANITEAAPVASGGPGRQYIISGQKWFMSAPMCDAFIVLAQAPLGLSCFLMPRFLADGAVNAIHFLQLKDKLGNRSNASSQVAFAGAHGWLIGEEGRGVSAILEMVTFMRLDCTVSSAGLMRLALANAIHHARHRSVFQKKLIDQPLMSQVLADMALDVEAATALAFRLARSFDRAEDARAAAWRRLMTPVTKYWVCKIAPALIYEAMECLGGNGYIEDGMLARLYREAPVNAIWEGSGNVMALDVLRVLQREGDAVEAVFDELRQGAAGDELLKAHIRRLETILHEPLHLDLRAREFVEGLAVAAAGVILRTQTPALIADAFIATRFGSVTRQTYGQGLHSSDVGAILERAYPGAD